MQPVQYEMFNRGGDVSVKIVLKVAPQERSDSFLVDPIMHPVCLHESFFGFGSDLRWR